MKQGWEIKKIKDICSKASSNIAQNKITELDGDYPVFGASGFVQNIDFYHQDTEYIGIVKDGSGVGRVNKYPAYSSLLGTLQYILPKEGYDLNYVGYALQSLNLAKYASGAAIPHIYFRDYGEETICVPPLTDQERIVAILDREFEKIDALKENAEKNLQHAKDLFQSALKQELQPKEGWERCKLCEVCTFYNGKPHENDIDENGEYILVNSKFISSDMQVYKKTSSQFFPLFAGDIVMVMSDVPNGKALAKCQIIHEDNLYSLNQRICVFRDAKIDVKLLYYLVNRNPYLIAFDNGENQTNLRKNDIVSMPICHPTNTKEVAGIVARLDYFRNKCQALEENYTKTIALCDDMKQALLRKAFNGEL